MQPFYTPEFFAHLEKMVDKRPHKCRDCGAIDGCPRINKDGTKQKFPAVVRLCLIDKTQPANDINNVGMYCTRCRKPDQVWKTPRRIKPSTLPQLFMGVDLAKGPDVSIKAAYIVRDGKVELSKLEELQRNARKKVERKPILDDEGNEVPF